MKVLYCNISSSRHAVSKTQVKIIQDKGQFPDREFAMKLQRLSKNVVLNAQKEDDEWRI
jgi:hypothetical protein